MLVTSSADPRQGTLELFAVEQTMRQGADAVLLDCLARMHGKCLVDELPRPQVTASVRACCGGGYEVIYQGRVIATMPDPNDAAAFAAQYCPSHSCPAPTPAHSVTPGQGGECGQENSCGGAEKSASQKPLVGPPETDDQPPNSKPEGPRGLNPPQEQNSRASLGGALTSPATTSAAIQSAGEPADAAKPVVAAGEGISAGPAGAEATPTASAPARPRQGLAPKQRGIRRKAAHE